MPVDRRRIAFNISALVYVLASVPLLSVSFVLPTISVGEAIEYVVATPVSLFAGILMFLLVIPTTVVIILAYLILSLAWVCFVVIGQPVPPIVHFWYSGTTDRFLAPYRNYKIYVREQGFNYLALVLAASVLFVGFRLLQAFSDVRS
jgi:hypothetical protein